jgi:hypothetical protein
VNASGWRYFQLRNRVPLARLEDAPAYWQGAAAGRDELLAAVAAGYDIGILPERSGLVILDCDIKLVSVEEKDGNVVLHEHHGVTDLEAACARNGEELPRTYAVSSLHGGMHYYFRQNKFHLLRSKAQRPGWLIDVKASRNTYCVCPPSEGYSVADDAPVALMPYWLETHIEHRLPDDDVPAVPAGDGTMPPQLEALITEYLSSSNHAGGWNNAVFRASCWFREYGYGRDEAERLIIQAAAPLDAREMAKAMRTLRSGWER